MNPLIVALDVDQAAGALALADRLRGAAGAFKIGSRLFTAEGPSLVRRFVEQGDRVFLDLKVHDIPHTVAASVAAAARLGVWMLTVHASGGSRMIRAAQTAAAGAALAAHQKPLVVAVTVLTSLDADHLALSGVVRSLDDYVVALARSAQQAGAEGVIASPHETQLIRAACGPGFLIVTPGIRDRLDDVAAPTTEDDQARTMTGALALAAGADYIVVGRPIIAAPDPRAAAERLLERLTN